MQYIQGLCLHIGVKRALRIHDGDMKCTCDDSGNVKICIRSMRCTIPDMSTLSRLTYVTITGYTPDNSTEIMTSIALSTLRNTPIRNMTLLSLYILDDTIALSNTLERLVVHNVVFKSATLSDILDAVPEGILSIKMTNLITDDITVHSIPNSVGRLTRLDTLLLKSISLDYIDDALYSLMMLRNLSIIHCNVVDISPMICKLTSLDKLELSHNCLSILPETFYTLDTVRVLRLDNNYLSNILDCISQMTNIIELYLDNNSMTGHIPHSMRQLTNLTVLSMKHNRLIGSLSTNKGCTLPPSLHSLDIRYNPDLHGHIVYESTEYDYFKAYTRGTGIYLYLNEVYRRDGRHYNFVSMFDENYD